MAIFNYLFFSLKVLIEKIVTDATPCFCNKSLQIVFEKVEHSYTAIRWFESNCMRLLEKDGALTIQQSNAQPLSTHL